MLETWPGQMRGVYGDHQRFYDTYFRARFPGKYFSGDGCRRDKDGYYWITGRVDDVIIVSGHNLGTAEIEGAIGGPQPWRGGGRRLRTRHQGQRHLRLRHAQDRQGSHRHDGKRDRETGPSRHWPARFARENPVHPRPAQDAVRQDHAPDPAQDRRGRDRQPGDTSTLADPAVVDSLVSGRIE